MNQIVEKPLIIGFIADLMFNVKISNVAQNLGFAVRWIEQEENIATLSHDEQRQRPPGEPLSGTAGALFELLTQTQPALLIFDLNNPAIPWERWIATLRSSPATRRFPILCYGAHVDVATMQKARELGADDVVARSRFTSALPELIQKYAQLPDLAALQTSCHHPIPPHALAGLQAFNQGDYFIAHEELEHAWNEDQSAGRNLWKGILQVGVGYLQIERGNYNGAVKMFLRARQWLAPFPDICRGIHIAQLRLDAENVYQTLLSIGAENIAKFDRNLLCPVQYEAMNHSFISSFVVASRRKT